MSFERNFSDHPAGNDSSLAELLEPLRTVRDGLGSVEDALALAMLLIAEADCKNGRENERCVEALASARDISTQALKNLTALKSCFASGDSARKAEASVGVGGAMPPTPRQIAKSAAHLIAAADDARLDEDSLPLIVQEAFMDLRQKCEAAGLMAPYVFPGDPTYKVMD